MRHTLFISLFLLFSCTFGFAADLVQKNTYGRLEKATLLPEQLSLTAKLDTGAKMTSLNAQDLEEFKRDGKTWVKFKVPVPHQKSEKVFIRKLFRVIKIKSRSEENGAKAEFVNRPVVLMKVCIGKVTHVIQVNLANRENFIYPLLLGRDAIVAFKGTVDPSAKFTQKSECAVSNETE